MARRYVRDRIGRFATTGSGGGGRRGQTTGRGAKLDNKEGRKKGGAGMTPRRGPQRPANTISKSAKQRKVDASSRAADKAIKAADARRASKSNVGKSPANTKAKKSGGSNNSVAQGRAAKAAYKSKDSSKRRSAAARKGGSFTKTGTFKNSGKAKQAKAREAKKRAKK